MNKKRIIGICLTLLMLFTAACGRNNETTPNSTQGYGEVAAGTTQGNEDTVPGITEEYEDILNDVLQRFEEPEITQGNEEPESETPQGYEEPEPETSQGNEDSASENPQEYEAATPEAQEPTPEPDHSQENEINATLPAYGNNYYDLVNVVLYLEIYDELPPNYITKNEARNLGWEGGSVENYRAGAAIGGDTFGNREGLLPQASGRSYTECDIDTHGYSSRGSRRLVFSNDGLYFYTSDHYESFSQVTVTADYEVIW